MLNFLQGVLEALKTVLSLITFGIREIFEFVNVIGDSFLLIHTCISELPVEISLFAMAGIAVTVILTIYRY